MALILNIDTSRETAGICLAKDGQSLVLLENREQRDHASWLHPAVDEILKMTGHRLKDLQAVAVSAGPGSYTGLRVGMAAAKGFCFALSIPLITEGTLDVMAYATREQYPDADLLCPMIDARRMEVFTAIYERDGSALLPPAAMVIDSGSFSGWLSGRKISFFGGGSDKCKQLINAPNAAFVEVKDHAGYLGILSFLRYLRKEFTGLAYSEPAYTKEFYTHKGK